MSPRGHGGFDGSVVGPRPRGGHHFSSKEVHVSLAIERVGGLAEQRPEIVIKAYDNDASPGGVQGDLIAEVGPAQMREAIILLSPELFAYFQDRLLR